MRTEPDRVIRLGQITGVNGVKGWVKVHSFTKPRSNLLDYRQWQLEQRGHATAVEVVAGRESGRRLIAKLAGIDDRDAAAGLVGAAINVRRSELPALAADEFYWADLVGLEVKNDAGERLGKVVGLIETGANDVLVLDGSEQHLIPFALGETVLRVDLDSAEIIVDWHASFWE